VPIADHHIDLGSGSDRRNMSREIRCAEQDAIGDAIERNGG